MFSTVGFRERGRIKDWTREFARWADAAWKEHEEADDHASYYFGVILGVSDAQHGARRDVKSMETESGQGYVDARVLINKVLKLGDAPEGDFYILLGMDSSEPIFPRR
jgi:hypothetical protein